MPYGIINDRKRAMTADYVGRMTSRGFKGRLVRPNRKPRDRKLGRNLNLNIEPNPNAPHPPAIVPFSVKFEITDPHLAELPFTFSPDIEHPNPDPISGDRSTLEGCNPKDVYRMKILQRPSTKTSQGSTSNELMKEWSDQKWPMYLKRIVQLEEPRSGRCEECRLADAGWRCLDCLGQPHLCKDCCRIGHRLSPFHKVEAWSGGHWTPAWLWHVGTCICLGHGRKPCPKYEATLEDLEDRLISVNPIRLREDNSFCAKPEKKTVGCGDVVCFLHTNGFHYIPVYTCWCSDAEPDDMQYLDHSFYPASWKSVRTALTFSVLQQFNLFKLHGHLSTETYLDILCRFTNDVFPSEAPDRRSTLRRVWTQWNYLFALRKNGFEKAQLGDRPSQGALALYCAVCPQPGVNLPTNWKEDADQWLYRRYLAADGNFVLDHLAVKEDGVRLLNGAAYMTEPTRYAKHIEATKEKNEPSTCAKLRAVSERNVFKKGYDVTGVVAIACARHGCFAPGGLVDLQKGERQLNVDYALAEALRLTKATDTPGGLLAYDINCQYCLKLRKRFKKGPYLSIDRSFPLDFVIGLFHVHGHKDECLARFAPTFFPGSGATSGEILESLWSQLNPSGRSTRHMTLGRRADSIDALVWYNNLRKLEGLASLLPKSLTRAESEALEAEKHMKDVKDSTESADRKVWKRDMEKAIAERKGRNTSMDIFLVQNPPVVPMQMVKAKLIDKETNANNVKKGVAAWVAMAIEVQAAQLDYLTSRRRSTDPTAAESVNLAKKGQALVKRIASVFREGQTLFPNVPLGARSRQWEDEEIEICVCEDECLCDGRVELPLGRALLDESSAEMRPIPLPSSFDKLPSGWGRVSKLEEELRVAQAEEALEALRVDIGHKSFLYLENRDWATGKRERTRGYDRINAVEENMRAHIKKYNCAKWSLERLKVASKYPHFQTLSRADTKAVTAVYDPNKRGDRNAGMSWIWRRYGSIEGVSDSESGLGQGLGSKEGESAEILKEIYRVKWMRARCRLDRWNEEVKYLNSEMSWYVSFMLHRATEYEEKAEITLKEGGGGSFLLREAAMWRRRAKEGRIQFGWEKDAKGKLKDRKAKKISKKISRPSDSDVDTDEEGMEDLTFKEE